MHLIEKRPSLEPCTEAQWYAWDYLLQEPLSRQDIQDMNALGHLLYMPMLRKPFFKVEGDYFHIKGFEGDRLLRIAVHEGHREVLEALEKGLLIEEK